MKLRDIYMGEDNIRQPTGWHVTGQHRELFPRLPLGEVLTVSFESRRDQP